MILASTEAGGDSSFSPSDFGSGVLLRTLDCERRAGDFLGREVGGNNVLNGEGRGVDGVCSGLSRILILQRIDDDGEGFVQRKQ